MKFSAALFFLVFAATSTCAAAVGGGAKDTRAIAADGILARSASPELDAHTNNLLPRAADTTFWTLWKGDGEIRVTSIAADANNTISIVEDLREKCKYPGSSEHGWEPKENDGFVTLLTPGIAMWFKDDIKAEHRCYTGFRWAMKLAAEGDLSQPRLFDPAGPADSAKIAYPSGADFWEPEKRFYRFISSSF